MPLTQRRKLTFVFILGFVATLLTYLALEAGFRFYQFRNLQTARWSHLMLTEKLYEASPEGYRYRAGLNLPIHWVADDGQIRTVHLQTNNVGLVSERDVEPRKANGEFRIGVLGDSLTACIHNDVRWVDLLHEKLKNDPKLKKYFGAQSLNFINLGLDGLGLPQMPSVLEKRRAELDLDFVIVNFITADIYRRPTWRTMTRFADSQYDYDFLIGCTTPDTRLQNPHCEFSNVLRLSLDTMSDFQKLESVRREISESVARRRDWFTPYPEFLSYALGGRLESWFGQNPYLPIPSSISDRQESLRESANAIAQMAKTSPQILFVHSPTYWEIIHNRVPDLALELIAKVEPVKIESTLSYLPPAVGEPEVNRWINYPTDMHWSNYGAEIYADSLAEYLRTVAFADRAAAPG